MNKKGFAKYQSAPGFAPLITILVIAILGVVGYFVYQTQVNKTQTAIQSNLSVNNQPIYKSILGFSFTKPMDLNVQEFGCDFEKIKADLEAQIPISATDHVSTLEMGGANGVSIVDYKKTNKAIPEGSLREILGLVPIAGCLKYYGDIQSVVDQVKNLYNTNQSLADTPLGGNSIAKSFNLTPYQNSKSGLYGVSFYNIGGFAEPGFGKFKIFYLLSPGDKYFIEAIYTIPDQVCSTLSSIEDKYRQHWDNNSDKEYKSALKQTVPECDKSNFKEKSDILLFLDSFKTLGQ